MKFTLQIKSNLKVLRFSTKFMEFSDLFFSSFTAFAFHHNCRQTFLYFLWTQILTVGKCLMNVLINWFGLFCVVNRKLHKVVKLRFMRVLIFSSCLSKRTIKSHEHKNKTEKRMSKRLPPFPVIWKAGFIENGRVPGWFEITTVKMRLCFQISSINQLLPSKSMDSIWNSRSLIKMSTNAIEFGSSFDPLRNLANNNAGNVFAASNRIDSEANANVNCEATNEHSTLSNSFSNSSNSSNFSASSAISSEVFSDPQINAVIATASSPLLITSTNVSLGSSGTINHVPILCPQKPSGGFAYPPVLAGRHACHAAQPSCLSKQSLKHVANGILLNRNATVKATKITATAATLQSSSVTGHACAYPAAYNGPVHAFHRRLAHSNSSTSTSTSSGGHSSTGSSSGLFSGLEQPSTTTNKSVSLSPSVSLLGGSTSGCSSANPSLLGVCSPAVQPGSTINLNEECNPTISLRSPSVSNSVRSSDDQNIGNDTGSSRRLLNPSSSNRPFKSPTPSRSSSYTKSPDNGIEGAGGGGAHSECSANSSCTLVSPTSSSGGSVAVNATSGNSQPPSNPCGPLSTASYIHYPNIYNPLKNTKNCAKKNKKLIRFMTVCAYVFAGKFGHFCNILI